MSETIVVNTEEVDKENSRSVIKNIIDDLEEAGYNAYKQVTEYLLTGEIGYISSYKEARTKIEKINRRDLVEYMLREFTK